MRWDHLFDDLEGQLARELNLEESELAAEDERLRLGRLEVRDRLVALHKEAVGTPYRVALRLRGGLPVTVRPSSLGRDWMLAELTDGARATPCILPLAAVETVSLTPGQVRDTLVEARTPDAPRIADRLGLGFVLRDLCRRRRFVDVQLTDSSVSGTIDRVGRDHLDLAVHEPPRRAAAVTEVRLIPFASVVLVRLA